MRIVFLGTGAGTPSKLRNVSSLAIQWFSYGGQTWLVDCGEATQHQILNESVKLGRINKIFITHLHGDHIFGLPGLLGSRSFQGSTSPLTIYGPAGIRSYIETSLSISQTHLRYPLEIIEISDGFTWEEKHFSFHVRKLDHGIPSFGFRIVEHDRPGALQVHKCKEMGIPAGPVYQELKLGKKVQLPNGQWVDGKDFLTLPKPGLKLAILGDTRITSSVYELAQNVDLLIHEATYRAGQEELAKEHFHSTSSQAATVARDAHVGTLILNHISSRFQEEEWPELLNDARQIFPKTEIAHDGWEYSLN